MQKSSFEDKKQKGKFISISCPRCKYSQIIFGKSATIIKCDNCNKKLIDITGGKTRIKAQVRRIWN